MQLCDLASPTHTLTHTHLLAQTLIHVPGSKEEMDDLILERLGIPVRGLLACLCQCRQVYCLCLRASYVPQCLQQSDKPSVSARPAKLGKSGLQHEYAPHDTS